MTPAPANTLDQFRRRFPIFRTRVYLNSCSQGAISVEVQAALAAFAESWQTYGSPWDQWVGEVERLRLAFATTIGADADEIAVMPNASTAIAAIATSLPFDGPAKAGPYGTDGPAQAGPYGTDTRRGVVLGEFEFPTNAHVWLAQQRRGARITWARARGQALPVDEYAAHINDTTLIVPATHVCFRNGYRLDVARLVALCRERGAYCMLDDYQRTGTAPIDVHALGVDFMVTGTLKYLLGPAGVSFLYVRRALLERLEPLVTGWFGRVDPFQFSVDRLDWSSTAKRFETGSPAVPSVYGAMAGLEVLQTLSPAVIETQIASLVERFITGAKARALEVMTPDDPARRGPLVVVRASDPATVVGQLAERGIIVSARGQGVRVSFHAYNVDDDADAALTALDAVIAGPRRR